MHAPRSILIIRASSGIGSALALACAAPGVLLALSGRLAETCDECPALGADVWLSVLDVIHRLAVEDWVDAVNVVRPLYLVIATLEYPEVQLETAKRLTRCGQSFGPMSTVS